MRVYIQKMLLEYIYIYFIEAIFLTAQLYKIKYLYKLKISYWKQRVIIMKLFYIPGKWLEQKQTLSMDSDNP